MAGEANPPEDSCLVTINAPHRARIIDNDVEALYNYLQVIGRARQSIEIESFVFNPDKSGRLVLQALEKKADEGVKVRILIDYYSNRLKPGLDAYYRDALAQHGIELRYFNVADILEFWKIGFRNHSKLLVVDGREMVTGGRNISDAYFGMAERVNYLDRDIWLDGPIVRAAAQNFELYWESPMTSVPKVPGPPVFSRSTKAGSSKHPKTRAQDDADYAVRLAAYEKIIQHARDALKPRPQDVELKSRIIQVGKTVLARSPIVEVHSVTWVSDRPIPGDAGRVVTPYLHKRLEGANHSLLIENFLFICKGQEKDMFLSLLKRKVRVNLLTNGFCSDPNFVMAEMANSRQNMAVQHGMNVFCYTGAPASDKVFSGEKAIWALHTKSIVIDGRDSVIGSYNFDPRSAEINDEGMIIINDSPEFARLLEQKIHNRIKNATQMNADGSYANGYHCNSPGRIFTVILRPFVEACTDIL